MVRARVRGAVLIAAAVVATGGPVAAQPAAVDTRIVIAVIADAPPIRAGHTANAVATIETTVGAPVVGASVQLRMRAYGASSFTTVGTDVSDSGGHLELATPVLLHNATFRWHFDASGAWNASTSSTWFVAVSPRVGIRVSDRTPHTGQRVVVRGHTYPSKAGNRVSLWRGTKPVQGFGPTTHHVRLVRGHVRADGSYRLVVRFSTSGSRRIYVKVGGGGGNVAGYSAYRWLHVS